MIALFFAIVGGTFEFSSGSLELNIQSARIDEDAGHLFDRTMRPSHSQTLLEVPGGQPHQHNARAKNPRHAVR